MHEEKEPHKCAICDAIFALKVGLKQHDSSAHEKKKTHKCISFAYTSSSKLHTSSVHNEKKTQLYHL